MWKKFFILAGTCIASAGDPFKVKLRRDSAHVREQKESRRNAKAAAAGIAAAALFLIVGHAAFGYGLIRYSLNFSTGSSDIWI